ncbi:MAG: hypothetical protein IH898_10040 [Planctomycetes bacterium]|nr:hypothetical protein [Planctomycetota bacterium]
MTTAAPARIHRWRPSAAAPNRPSAAGANVARPLPAILDGSIGVDVVDPWIPAKVEIDGLADGTQYYYRVIGPMGAVATGTFRTPHAEGRHGLRFGVSGDWRGELRPYVSIANLPSRDLDFFVALVDTIYADVASIDFINPQAETADDFFHAARSFFRPWLRRKIDLRVWESVRWLLGEPDHPLRRLELDIVTFGTPVRYGWDADGYANLLHFIHHRPPPQGVEYQAPVPIESGRMLSAVDGDYVQQIGISGSNLAPNPLALRTLAADWRLDKFLERDVPRERLLTRLKHGTRVPDEGTTLLVDYERDEGGIHHHLLGHAVYTRRKWLPLHCREVAARFYGARFHGASA